MREILFRGKKLDNEWVYGVPLISEFDGYKSAVMVSPNAFYVSVNVESVGQYTGLKDKNGAKIFEGDIVINEEHSYNDDNGFECKYFIVKYTDEEVGSCGCCYNEFSGIGFVGEEITGKKHRTDNIRFTWIKIAK